jgi:hypothetical protein
VKSYQKKVVRVLYANSTVQGSNVLSDMAFIKEQYLLLEQGTRSRTCLRHYVTSRKVMGLIPD